MNGTVFDLTVVLPWLDLFGIAIFAVTGALAAARLKQTLVTFSFFALITGVGGGTVRDLLIGVPVFWVQDARVPLVCLAAALLIWMTPNKWWKESAVNWFDAAGLAAYSVFGTAKALEAGIDFLAAAMMGVITACVGGIIRDVMAGEPSMILGPELYVTAAAFSSVAFVLLTLAGVPFLYAALLAALAGFALRAFAMTKGIALPNYRGTD